MRWHHNKRPSFAVISSTEISWMAKRKIIVQIIPSVILRLPSTISSAPIDTNFTPFDAMKSRALLTLAICWKRRKLFFLVIYYWLNKLWSEMWTYIAKIVTEYPNNFYFKYLARNSQSKWKFISPFFNTSVSIVAIIASLAHKLFKQMFIYV